MTLKLGVLIGVPLALIALIISSGFAVIDVRESGPDGSHIIVPVPLALARGAALFVPDELTNVECDEDIERYIPMAERAVAVLREAPDVELVRVEERGELVSIHKRGETLLIHVDERDGEQVRLQVPLESILEVLESYEDGHFDASKLVGAVARVDGDLVHVKSDDEEVRIWVW